MQLKRLVVITMCLFVGCEAFVSFDGLEFGDDGVAGNGGAADGGGGSGATSAGGEPSTVGGAGGLGPGGSGGDCGTGAYAGGCELNDVPDGGGCPLECSTCDGGVCIKDCGPGCTAGGGGMGGSVTFTCPEGYACEVECVAQGACERLIVECPSDHDCDVSCQQPRACRGLELRCDANGSCDINCGPYADVCTGAQVDCGSKSCEAYCSNIGGAPPSVSCNASCGCKRCC